MAFLRRNTRTTEASFPSLLEEQQRNTHNNKNRSNPSIPIQGNIITHILKHHVRNGKLFSGNHCVDRHSGGQAMLNALRRKGVVGV